MSRKFCGGMSLRKLFCWRIWGQLQGLCKKKIAPIFIGGRAKKKNYFSAFQANWNILHFYEQNILQPLFLAAIAAL